MSQYDDLIGADGPRTLRNLYPHDFAIQDCPASADALDDYLTTGQPIPAPPTVASRFNITARFRTISRPALVSYVMGLGPNHHVVVKGTRPPSASLTNDHYFVVANIAGQVYVLDAMTGDITRDFAEYYDRQEFNHLYFTTHFEATEAAVF